MLLNVNPNRMELLRLRQSLLIAQRGHKLLQDKLEQMMRRFLVLLKDIDKAKQDFQIRTHRVCQELLYCRITTSIGNFIESLSKIDAKILLSVSRLRIMNLLVSSFNIEELKIDKHYDFFRTSAQLDLVVAEAPDYINSVLKLAQLFRALDILSSEIERTRRRVNALEYMLIPSIQDTIRHITQRLNELERGSFVRLMRVKEIVKADFV